MGKIRILTWVVAILLLLPACDAGPSPGASASGRAKAPSAQQMDFPVKLAQGVLVAESLSSYTGPYWEDGSGEEVENIAALLLYNPTDRLVEFAAVAVEWGAQTLYFFVYDLPPDSRCLVLERNRIGYEAEELRACRELSVHWGRQELSREQIDYVGLGPQLAITNRDGRMLNHVTVHYKRYLQAQDCYLGGAVFSQHLFSLQGQERRCVMPQHYRAGEAKIVGIEVEI